MKNRTSFYSFILILLLLCAFPAAAQQDFSSRVVDADSREPLPFAKVMTKSGAGVLTNYEGNFHIQASASDTLHISLIGYNPFSIVAGNLPKTVRLKVQSQLLREVTVTPIQPFLVRASKKLAKEFAKHENQTSTFFLRMRQDYFQDSLTWAGLKRQMIEAFLSGQSAVNLRSPKVITGYRSGYAPERLRGNAYQLIQIGAMVLGDGSDVAGEGIVTPLHPKASAKYYDQYYDIHETRVLGQHGQNLRRIRFSTYTDVTRPIIVGTLLIDYDTMQPLSFNGSILNLQELVNVDEFRTMEDVAPHFRIQYRHDRGFTEVSTLYVRDRLLKKDSRSTLVNVGQMVLPPGIPLSGENLFESIDAAGFDRQFWSEHETVTRTDDEEYLFTHSTNNPTATGDSTAQHTNPHLAKAEQRYLAELVRRNSIALKQIQGSVVVEAGSNRPLPFTDVTVVGRTRTVTNMQGFYKLLFQPEDTLLFQAAGYEPLKLAGKDVRRVVRLTPFRVVEKNPKHLKIREVLTKIGVQMEEALSANRTDSAIFHYRRIRTLLRDSVMTEAFLKAPDIVKLNEPEVLLARNYYRGKLTRLDSIGDVMFDTPSQDNLEILKARFKGLSDDQMQMLVKLLPKTVQRSWKQMEEHKRDFDRPFAPLIGLNKPKHYIKAYEPEDEEHIPFSFLGLARQMRNPSVLELLEDQNGHRYCRIELKRRWLYHRSEGGSMVIKEQSYPAIIGTLLIDLDNMQLLSFDGSLKGVLNHAPTMKDFRGLQYEPNISIRYDFSYERGWPEVWHYASNVNASIGGIAEQLTADWFCMFNTRGMDLELNDEWLEHATLRLRQEEGMGQGKPLEIDHLYPSFFLFDIFSENAKFRLLRW
ncbi:MAG: carboxypeptidase-like regulatory domain-containing protein [Bacteroidaceae bacterium]|nr:carboxypeptidase-like regulatory domain-containing protein [Bacteroidaceae bacterium]